MTTIITDSALHSQKILGGDTWSILVKRGQALVLEDPTGLGNCAMLAYHGRNTSERYNMPDSLKGQHTAKYTSGHCLYSDMGRVLIGVAADERGWHDPLGAYSTPTSIEKQFGSRRYQEFRNQRNKNTLDNLLVELGKHGLNARDWQAPVNWFSSVIVDEDGKLHFDTNRNKAGQKVLLHAELDTLLIFSATPHPLDPMTTWEPQDIYAHLIPNTDGDKTYREHCDENDRALTLTAQAVLSY